MEKSVFISYPAKAHTEEVFAVCAFLERQGIGCWIAPRDVRAGQDYGSQIIDGIENCVALVLILSEQSNSSRYVRNEVERAYSKNKVIFTVRLQDIKPAKALELFISHSQWVDAWGQPLEQCLGEMVSAIRGLSSQQAERPSEEVTMVRAWRGPPPETKSLIPSEAATPSDEEIVKRKITRSQNAIGRQPLMNGDVFWAINILTASLATFAVGFLLFRKHGRDLLSIARRHGLEGTRGEGDVARLCEAPNYFFWASTFSAVAGAIMVITGVLVPTHWVKVNGTLPRDFDLMSAVPVLPVGLVCFVVGVALMGWWMWWAGRALFEYRECLLILDGDNRSIKRDNLDATFDEDAGAAFFRHKFGSATELFVIWSASSVIGYLTLEYIIKMTMLPPYGVSISGLSVFLISIAMIMSTFSLWACYGREVLIYSLFGKCGHIKWAITAMLARCVLVFSFLALPIMINLPAYRAFLGRLG